MATSSVCRAWLASALFSLLLIPSVLGQQVEPSNATLSTEAASTLIQFRVGKGSSAAGIYDVAPLTLMAGLGQSPVALSAISIYGDGLKLIDSSGVGNLTVNNIAFVNCDPTTDQITTSDLVGMTGNVRPQAIVLFSLTMEHCILTGDYAYETLYSMTSLVDSTMLATLIRFNNELDARLGNSARNASQGGQASPNKNDGGLAPATTVAMSILYGITGIVTLLFLAVIAAGAIRAHRHPEQYGPRSGLAGRPRQTRVKGLARAMLETLPIVKFGDPEPAKPANHDVELESQTVRNSPEVVSQTMTGVAATRIPADVESGIGPAQEGKSTRDDHHETASQDNDLDCSICTDDFIAGEDVRVLPCNHKYHPACVDPWLLNVSGTCPLCRHDLRPARTLTNDSVAAHRSLPQAANEGTAAGGVAAPSATPADTTATDGQQRQNQRRRMSRFLDFNLLRHAPPDERIAALRLLRQQTQREGVTANGISATEVEDSGREASVTARLRDAFRIRTSTAVVQRSTDGAGGP